MIEIKRNNGSPVKVFAETFEYEAYDQVKKLANYEPYSDSTIRIMPDAHAGAGCTVGTTMTLHGKVTPNLVGVDIGCGMLVVPLGKNLCCDYAKLDTLIREKIPSGFDIHNTPVSRFNELDSLICAKEVDLSRAVASIGSLGGGNHFIEVDYSEKSDDFYLVIHSGSRNLGVQVCKYYQDKAFRRLNSMGVLKNELVKRLRAEGREKEIQAELKKIKKPSCDKALAHLDGEDFQSYIHDMNVVQRYAIVNRGTMAKIILTGMGWNVEGLPFHTIHNYIDMDDMVLRKGAVRAERGERLIIPMNMRDGSLICVGKGNPDWNNSAPHGAGRLMSRSKAKESLSMEDFEKSMSGVYTTSVNTRTIDESPMVYKPMEEIIRCIEPTVEIVDIIKPEYNFKAGE